MMMGLMDVIKPTDSGLGRLSTPIPTAIADLFDLLNTRNGQPTFNPHLFILFSS